VPRLELRGEAADALRLLLDRVTRHVAQQRVEPVDAREEHARVLEREARGIAARARDVGEEARADVLAFREAARPVAAVGRQELEPPVAQPRGVLGLVDHQHEIDVGVGPIEAVRERAAEQERLDRRVAAQLLGHRRDRALVVRVHPDPPRRIRDANGSSAPRSRGRSSDRSRSRASRARSGP
jgi:hypothetical protein